MFATFQEKSSLSDQNSVFSSGVNAASEIAANLELYLKRYLDGTTVFHQNSNYNGQLYSDYKKIDGYKPNIQRTEFSKFSDSKSFYFIYTFMNIINNLNVLSLYIDKKVHPRYRDNLLEVRTKLVNLIETLINGLCNENNIYEMCYSTNHSNSYYPLEKLIKIVEFDSKRSINDLILAHYPRRASIIYDESRVDSLNTCISLVKEIDSLLSRSDQLSDLRLEEMPEITDLVWLALNDE